MLAVVGVVSVCVVTFGLGWDGFWDSLGTLPSRYEKTEAGRPLPQDVIPLDHVDGPVLAIAGAEDRLWRMAGAWARQIVTELARDRVPHQALIYPGAGHGVGTFPYLAAGIRGWNALTGRVLDHGGTRAADAAAKAQGWPKTLAFIAAMGR